MTVAADRQGEILDHALALMSERGAQTMSMRELAKACEVNVATLYHYFGSKAELLRAVIEERRYHELLREECPGSTRTSRPGSGWRPCSAGCGEPPWSSRTSGGCSSVRACGGTRPLTETTSSVMTEIEASFARWLDQLFPELDRDAPPPCVLRGELLSLMVESLLVPEETRTALLDQRCQDVATVLFPAE